MARQYLALIYPDMVSTLIGAAPFSLKGVSGFLKTNSGVYSKMADAADDYAKHIMTKTKIGRGVAGMDATKGGRFALGAAKFIGQRLCSESRRSYTGVSI